MCDDHDFPDFGQVAKEFDTAFIRRVLEHQGLNLDQFWQFSELERNRQWDSLLAHWEVDVVIELLRSIRQGSNPSPLIADQWPDAPPHLAARAQVKFEQMRMIQEVIRTQPRSNPDD